MTSLTELCKDHYTSISQAVQDSWNELDEGTGYIDISQFLHVVEGISKKVGKTRDELFSQNDIETYEKFKNENKSIKIFRDEFEGLFQGLAGCELNTQILNRAPNEDDDTDSDASISQAIQPPIDTSTPLRKNANLSNMSQMATRPVLEEIPLNNVDRSQHGTSKLNHRLDDQENQIREYEERMAKMEQEKVDLYNQIKQFKDQLRELQASDSQKDLHIKAIESDLQSTRQRLERKSPPRVIYPKSNELTLTISKLNDKIANLEQEKADVKRSADEMIEDMARQQKQTFKQLEERRLEEEAQKAATDITMSEFPPSTLAQKLHMALDQQRRLLSQFSNEGTSNQANYLFIGTILIMAILTRIIIFSTSAPWWMGTMLESPASAIDAWLKSWDGTDIYPI